MSDSWPVEHRPAVRARRVQQALRPLPSLRAYPAGDAARTDFLACFTHAGGRKSAQSVELKRNILAVLIAGATNLGLTRMSEACGVSYDTLAWTQEWYVREDTLRDANTVIVNHHYGLELAGKFGGGTMSSSDGQRFPVRGKSLAGRQMERGPGGRWAGR